MTTIGSRYRGTNEYDAVGGRLISAARERQLVTYKELALLIGIRPRGSHMSREIGQVLGELSEDEYRAGRPMLSCLAVHTGDRKPGEGFFVLQLGLLSEMADNDERRLFWSSQCQAAYEAWKGTQFSCTHHT